MYKFDYVNISPDKDPKDNIKIIKSYLDELVDTLGFLSEQVDKIDERTKGVK